MSSIISGGFFPKSHLKPRLKSGLAALALMAGMLLATTAMAAPPADENYDDNPGYTVNGSNSFTLDGIAYAVTGTAGPYSHMVTNDPSYTALAGGGSDSALVFDSVGQWDLSSVQVGASDGSHFKLARLSFDLISDASITITPYDGATPGTALIFNTPNQYVTQNNLDLSANTHFQNITHFVISGTNLMVALDDLDFEPAVLPDSTPPTVTGVTSSTANGTYKAGDVIAVQVNFSEPVLVTGTPQLTLETGATDRTVNYASGSGTGTLTFNYTVQVGDSSADLDYVATSALALNGGTLKDAAGNNAVLTLATPGAANSLGANKNLVVDGVAPTVSGVTSSTTNGTYKAGDAISIQVNFSEAVTVNTGGGTPQLVLETGATDRAVGYSSGSGTSTLTFNYTVQAGDSSADLDYVATSSLALGGGTIRDVAGNDATLTLASPGAANSLGANKNLVIDGVAPAVTSIVPTGSPASTAVSVDFIVTFSEAVTGVDSNDFELTLVNSAAGMVASVTGSGTTYTVTVNAISGSGSLRLDLKGSGTGIVDAVGNVAAGYSSGTAHTVAIPTAPGAPTIGTATAGDALATVTFTAPASDGGSAITTYTATPSPAVAGGPFTCAGPTACPITVTGLTNGTAYTFTVTATNGTGTSAASGATNPVTPKANQTITFAQPANYNFGTTPTLSATASSGLAVAFSSSTTSVCTITSGGALTFVSAGTCTIDADQAGDASTNAASTVARSFTVNAIVPDAPVIGTATAGNQQATVTFSAPSST
ncbi:adhesin, partial [Stenotrophomonas sp. MYb238]|uniref:beta strand repeat-containing protein n=1 Tax=Stenotrophomonas sp. MYb238 TaxID=2040281 RepID=UPI0013234912